MTHGLANARLASEPLQATAAGAGNVGGFAGSMFSFGRDSTNNRFPCSKLKLDNLFLQWLSSSDSQQLVRSNS